MNPQITKNYAIGDLESMELLCYRGNKFAFLLLFVITLPAMINIEFILDLWLVEVPAYTVGFVLLILIDALIDVLLGTSQYITAMMATGKIRKYQIVTSLIIISVLPLGYILLRLGLGPYSIIYALIFVSLFADLSRFFFCRKQIGFSFKRLLSSVWVPSFLTILTAAPIPILVRFVFYTDTGWKGFLVNGAVSLLSAVLCAWFVAMTRGERKTIKNVIVNKINHLRGRKHL